MTPEQRAAHERLAAALPARRYVLRRGIDMAAIAQARSEAAARTRRANGDRFRQETGHNEQEGR